MRSTAVIRLHGREEVLPRCSARSDGGLWMCHAEASAAPSFLTHLTARFFARDSEWPDRVAPSSAFGTFSPAAAGEKGLESRAEREPFLTGRPGAPSDVPGRFAERSTVDVQGKSWCSKCGQVVGCRRGRDDRGGRRDGDADQRAPALR